MLTYKGLLYSLPFVLCKVKWHLMTPLHSNVSAWEMELKWSNGSVSKLARRQPVSFIRDVKTGKPTHLINGADFIHHPSPTGDDDNWCEGCHWGTGVTLIQPLNSSLSLSY